MRRDIDDYIYKNRLKKKIEKHDSFESHFHVIAINKRNIPLIDEIARNDNILLLIEDYIAYEYLAWQGIGNYDLIFL